MAEELSPFMQAVGANQDGDGPSLLTADQAIAWALALDAADPAVQEHQRLADEALAKALAAEEEAEMRDPALDAADPAVQEHQVLADEASVRALTRVLAAEEDDKMEDWRQLWWPQMSSENSSEMFSGSEESEAPTRERRAVEGGAASGSGHAAAEEAEAVKKTVRFATEWSAEGGMSIAELAAEEAVQDVIRSRRRKRGGKKTARRDPGEAVATGLQGRPWPPGSRKAAEAQMQDLMKRAEERQNLLSEQARLEAFHMSVYSHIHPPWRDVSKPLPFELTKEYEQQQLEILRAAAKAKSNQKRGPGGRGSESHRFRLSSPPPPPPPPPSGPGGRGSSSSGPQGHGSGNELWRWPDFSDSDPRDLACFYKIPAESEEHGGPESCDPRRGSAAQRAEARLWSGVIQVAPKRYACPFCFLAVQAFIQNQPGPPFVKFSEAKKHVYSHHYEFVRNNELSDEKLSIWCKSAFALLSSYERHDIRNFVYQ